MLSLEYLDTLLNYVRPLLAQVQKALSTIKWDLFSSDAKQYAIQLTKKALEKNKLLIPYCPKYEEGKLIMGDREITELFKHNLQHLYKYVHAIAGSIEVCKDVAAIIADYAMAYDCPTKVHYALNAHEHSLQIEVIGDVESALS